MPRKVAEIIRMIEADGWYLVVTRGSHRQYRHPTKPGRTTVAGRPSDTLHPRTERSILKQSGLYRGEA
ncbi:type II toxin-antitoxin system HicA family toxin [Pseudonocardia kongjuensis]|uniref:Type II toxin-antitoxin system HicA family toxin n=1 Tax=Pseudonocardia kongjuensis TaxID=102227 RepID=A0ABN1Y7F9_9PSEU